MENAGSIPPTVELTGHLEDGTPFKRTAPAAEVMQLEEKIRETGGRVNAARLLEAERPRPPGVTREEFAQFNEMLADSVQRGVPLCDGIRDLARDARKSQFRESLREVADGLERGASLREAFAPARAKFPPLYGHLLEAGAAAGDLSGVLLALSRNIRTDAAFRRAILEACVYPLLLVFLILWFLTGFGMFILPRFERVAELLPMKMPLLTQWVSIHDPNARAYLLLAVLAAGVLAVVWFGWARWRRFGRAVIETVVRRTPVLRGFYEAAVWSAAADTLALLMRAQVPAPTALRLVGPATGTRWLAGACARLADRIETGEALSAAARADREVPMRVVHAFDTGEIQQDMPGALSSLAERYRYEADRRAQLVARYLPPAFALLFGGIVFLLALAVLGPYFRFWGAPW